MCPFCHKVIYRVLDPKDDCPICLLGDCQETRRLAAAGKFPVACLPGRTACAKSQQELSDRVARNLSQNPAQQQYAEVRRATFEARDPGSTPSAQRLDGKTGASRSHL